MNSELLPISGNSRELAVSEDLRIGLEYYWKRWGSKSDSVGLHLPDFSNPDWKYQDTPQGYVDRHGERYSVSEVKGNIIQTPYYKIDKDTDTFAALRDLVYAAQVGGYGIIIDVGCGATLTPLIVAGKYDRTIVIAIDPFTGPFSRYPDKYSDNSSHNWEYPYVAKHISETKSKTSAAFYFRLDVQDVKTQDVLAGSAWRVQIIAPDPETRSGDELVDIVFSASELVSPGGEMIVTGDGITMGTYSLGSTFNPESYTTYSPEGREMIRRMQRLQGSYASFFTRAFKGSDLFRNYGIGDSGWFQTIQTVMEGKYGVKEHFFQPPGIAIFSGKK